MGQKKTKPKQDIDKGELMCFVGAAYGNEPAKRISTTGFDFTFSGGAVVYRSKTKTINALSSTEAELIAAITAAKTDRFLRSMLQELGFPHESPTPIYEDNDPTIDIVNSDITTERTHYIDIRFFAIKVWKEAGAIIMHHIDGIISLSNDLTKPLGWVLHFNHAGYMMGHYNISVG